jgi:ribosomal protein L40E
VTEVQETTRRAAQAAVCPQCGKVEHVQKISAIPDMPAEFAPPERPSWFDLLGVVSLVGGLLLFVALAYVFRSALDMDACLGILFVTFFPIAWGFSRVYSRWEQRPQWDASMRLWKRLYFCPRDEVVFIPGETSVIPLRKIRDLFYVDHGEVARLARKPERVADLSPMPEGFADFARMLEEAKEKNGTLICFDCGHHNPVGQTSCEQCRAWVPQTAKARWVYGKHE